MKLSIPLLTWMLLSICLSYLPAISHAEALKLQLTGHKSKTITNDYMWTINATCTIHTDNPKTILVSSLEKGSKINGKKLSSGQRISLKIKDKENLTLSAKPGAKVEIINLSGGSINAKCSA
jgi:hypothetical protein